MRRIATLYASGILAAGTMALVILAGDADAGERISHHHAVRHHVHQRHQYHHVARADRYEEHLRANDCDPGGEYSGYPDWARAAFTCGRR